MLASDQVPEEGTPEMAALRDKIDTVNMVLRWLKCADGKRQRDFHLSQLKSLGFQRVVDVEGWFLRLRRNGFDVQSMRRCPPPVHR
jgi:hypothetical protein